MPAGKITISFQEEGDKLYTLKLPQYISEWLDEYIADFNQKNPDLSYFGKFDLFLKTIWNEFLGDIIESNPDVITSPELEQTRQTKENIRNNIKDLELQKQNLLKNFALSLMVE